MSDVAAVGVDDEKFGQRLKAFVVLESGKKATEDELKSYVKKNLASFKVPREVEFIDELPRNATGKVLKRELVEDEEEKKAGEVGVPPTQAGYALSRPRMGGREI